MKKNHLVVAALAGAVYLFAKKSGALSGMGCGDGPGCHPGGDCCDKCKSHGGVHGMDDIDPASPEYSDWYYNQYLPYLQQGNAYQSGGYGQTVNPYTQQYFQPNPYAQPGAYGYGGGPAQCQQQGRYWDSFSNQCIGSVPVSQGPAPIQQPYQVPQYTAPQTVDSILQQGLSAGVIIAIKQTNKLACKGSQYCNTIFADGTTGKRKMNYKAAANFVRKIMGTMTPVSSVGTNPYPYSITNPLPAAGGPVYAQGGGGSVQLLPTGYDGGETAWVM